MTVNNCASDLNLKYARSDFLLPPALTSDCNPDPLEIFDA